MEGSRKATKRRISGAERRRVVLGAAEEVFARRGYHAASLEEIARAAGVSKPVVYDHFASKRELHVTLLKEQLGALLEHVAAGVPEGGPAETRLRLGVEAFFGFVEEHPYAWRMMFFEAAAGEPEVAEAHRRIQAEATAFNAALLASDPLLGPPGCPGHDRKIEMLAEMLKSGLNGLAAWWYEHPEVPRERVVDVAVGFAWSGLDRLRTGARRDAGETETGEEQPPSSGA